MSRIIALLLLLFLLGPILFLSLLLMIFQGNPIFFLQERVGKNKQPFSIYKLRTMENQQVTKIGLLLRKTGLDEIPQLINILLGNMNFVGPRPLTQSDIDRLGWNESYYASRWDVKPGITGLAQLSPICNKKMSSFLDRYYSNNRTIFLDFKIILYSFIGLVVGKKYARKRFFR